MNIVKSYQQINVYINSSIIIATVIVVNDCFFVAAEKPIVGPAHFTPQSSTYDVFLYAQFTFSDFVSRVIFFFSYVLSVVFIMTSNHGVTKARFSFHRQGN